MSKVSKTVVSNESQKTKDSILLNFAEFAQKIGRMPEYAEIEDGVVYELHNNGEVVEKPLSKRAIEHHFHNLPRLRSKALAAHPKLLENVVEETVYMPKKMGELNDVLSRRNVKTVVITSANAGASLHKGLDAIKTFAKAHKAAIILGATEGELDMLPEEVYADEDIHVLFQDIHLNKSICVSVAPISKRNTEPLSSRLKKQVRINNSSMIFFSPFLGSESIPCEPSRHPDVMISTGSISKPEYTSEGRKTLSDESAEYLHNLSAIVVELNDDETFFWRNVMIDPNSGDLVDYGIRYRPNGQISTCLPQYLAYGDIHSYVKDEEAFNCALSIGRTLKIAEAIVHDVMDCYTESHHKVHRKAERASMVMAGEANYGHEIKVLTEDFNSLTEVHKKGVRIVPSNHDDMDSRSLESGDFQTGDLNSVWGCMLFPYQVAWNLVAQGKKNVAKIVADYMHVSEKELLRRYPGLDKGIAPLQAAVEFCGPKYPTKLKWHRRNDSYKVGRTELLLHGDKGNNGGGYSVGSALLAVGTGSAISGHSHSSKIRGHLMVLGCLAKKKQTYNMGGFSSWSHTVAIGYGNGMKQLITIMDGRHTNFDLAKLIKKYS